MKTEKKTTGEISGTSKSLREKNKDLVRRAVEEIWNLGKYDILNEFITTDFTIHTTNPDEKVYGLEGVVNFYTELRSAFPDIHFKIDSQVAEEDRVVTQWTAQGTHRGNFRGIPATGRKFKIMAVDIERIVDGRVVECWPSMDEFSLLQQLGATLGPTESVKS